MLSAVREDQRRLPTACDEFDVRTLSSHLLGTVDRVIAIAELGNAESVPPLAPEHDAETFAQLAKRAKRAWADDTLLDSPVMVRGARRPAARRCGATSARPSYTGWDLAVATGQPFEAGPAPWPFGRAGQDRGHHGADQLIGQRLHPGVPHQALGGRGVAAGGRSGRDPRPEFKAARFAEGVQELKDRGLYGGDDVERQEED